MILEFNSKTTKPRQKFTEEDVITWLRTFFIENGISDKHIDKYVTSSKDAGIIATIKFEGVSNSKYTLVYGSLLVLLSTASLIYLSHTEKGRVNIVTRYSKNDACKEVVNLIKDNIIINI